MSDVLTVNELSRFNRHKSLGARGAKTHVSAVCSTDGMMTLVADLSAMVLGGRGGSPDRPYLLDRSCRPEAWDGGRALFSFPVNGCGAKVQVV